MRSNADRLIKLPINDSKENYLHGFWQWVDLLAARQFEQALDALYWPHGMSWTPDALEDRIRTFFGGDVPWSAVVPNDRLIGVINDSATIQLRTPAPGWMRRLMDVVNNVPASQSRHRQRDGWFMAQIPVTTASENPKDDQIPLMGMATSFFVRELRGTYVLEFEIFHA